MLSPDFISHSMSMKQLEYVMRYLMPSLRMKTLLDVGSRTGAVIFAVSIAEQLQLQLSIRFIIAM
jgi:hypothetical protein